MVLRHRDFALMWVGQLISKLGSQFNYVALAWLMLQMTGSAVATGGVYLAAVLPAVVGWAAGAVVDRSDRRLLMLGLDVARGFLVALLPLAWYLGFLHPALVYAVVFAVSLLTLLFFPAEKAALPHLVPAEELTEANAYSEMTEQFGGMVGPALAGVLIGLLPSPALLLIGNAVTFWISALTLLLLRWRDTHETTGASFAELRQEIGEGLAFLIGNPFLRRVVLTGTVANFFVSPFSVAYPVLADRTLHAGAQGFGYLMGGIGAGMLCGSLASGWISRRFSPRVVIFSGFGIMGLGLAGQALTTSLPLCVLLSGVIGFGVAPANAVVLTLVSLGTPERLQGRVFASLFSLMAMAVPLGAAASGPLIEHFGPRHLLLMMGAGILLTALVGGGGASPPREQPASDEE